MHSSCAHLLFSPSCTPLLISSNVNDLLSQLPTKHTYLKSLHFPIFISSFPYLPLLLTHTLPITPFTRHVPFSSEISHHRISPRHFVNLSFPAFNFLFVWFSEISSCYHSITLSLCHKLLSPQILPAVTSSVDIPGLSPFHKFLRGWFSPLLPFSVVLNFKSNYGVVSLACTGIPGGIALHVGQLFLKNQILAGKVFSNAVTTRPARWVKIWSQCRRCFWSPWIRSWLWCHWVS